MRPDNPQPIRSGQVYATFARWQTWAVTGPEVPGLDLLAVLARAADSRALYSALRWHAEAFPEIMEALHEGRPREALRRVSGLRGLACVLGAEPLVNCASDLEAALRDETPWGQELAATQYQVRRLLSALSKLAEPPAEDERLGPLLLDLVGLLRGQDLPTTSHLARIVVGQLERSQYEEALRCVLRLARALGFAFPVGQPETRRRAAE